MFSKDHHRPKHEYCTKENIRSKRFESVYNIAFKEFLYNPHSLSYTIKVKLRTNISSQTIRVYNSKRGTDREIEHQYPLDFDFLVRERKYLSTVIGFIQRKE